MRKIMSSSKLLCCSNIVPLPAKAQPIYSILPAAKTGKPAKHDRLPASNQPFLIKQKH
jgi:hypothetical protein